MKIIGLVGGIASGKTMVAEALARRGAAVLNADELAHLVLDAPEVREQLVARWGSEILTPAGAADRAAIAQRVFAEGADAGAGRKFLERLIHPLVRRRVEAAIAQLPPTTPAVVIDAPLLIEAGWADDCDVILFVDAPLDHRRGRAAHRGWSDEEFARREAAQLPIDKKRRRATHTIDNSASPTETDAAVGEFWARLFAQS